MSGQDDIPDIPGVPEDELLAAELALGVLEFDERARARARAAWDPGFAALVAAWEDRLSGMAEDVPAVPPPPSARRRILRELFGEGPEVVEPEGEAAPESGPERAPESGPEPAAAPAPAPTPIRPARRREVFAWRTLAAACVVFGAVAVLRPDLAPVHFGPADHAQVRYVALIQGDAGGPGFFAVLDETTGETLVRQVSGPEPADGVYQMWMANEGAPVSMGLLEGGSQALRMPAELLAPGGGFLPGAHFGVSLEPPGGSPTGAPTDVVATGDPERF